MSNWNYILPTSQKGWECPRCGRILAPWMSYCICNKSNKYHNVTKSTCDPSTLKGTYATTMPKIYESLVSNCDNCKYTNLSFNEYPCSICDNYDMFKPVDSEK